MKGWLTHEQRGLTPCVVFSCYWSWLGVCFGLYKMLVGESRQVVLGGLCCRNSHSIYLCGGWGASCKMCPLLLSMEFKAHPSAPLLPSWPCSLCILRRGLIKNSCHCKLENHQVLKLRGPSSQGCGLGARLRTFLHGPR